MIIYDYKHRLPSETEGHLKRNYVTLQNLQPTCGHSQLITDLYISIIFYTLGPAHCNSGCFGVDTHRRFRMCTRMNCKQWIFQLRS